ncbi:hypothetical protein L1987_27078 [Smallanthus sonchifolius]|uniref:Uncharacterized protein n=1 Tax=Smallanthus sonchifolius TaxID=185202 RepID=A0ACB9I9Z2_9ASTR|nr:hypothetical protein L1987_27078 [Smallanthus sonchifolius]
MNSTTSSSIYPFVAVEFDTYGSNDWDPKDPDTAKFIDEHVGININSITSVAYKRWLNNIRNGGECKALINYYADSKTLSVSFTSFQNNSTVWETGLDWIIDLRDVLPERVIFGFSASTGDRYERNNASKESDVFSFGVVALEIACGRKPIDPHVEERKRKLVEWVWDLYGTGTLLEAADSRLGSNFAEVEITCLMIVGLWCAHPDSKLRPSMKQALQVLNSEASLPILPSKMPYVTYSELPASSYGGTLSSGSNNLLTSSTATS